MAQEFNVIGKRNPNDKLEDIVLTRSISLNGLTNAQLGRVYRKLQGLQHEFLNQTKMTYQIAMTDGLFDVCVQNVHYAEDFDSVDGGCIVMDCGYITDLDRFCELRLYQDKKDYKYKFKTPYFVQGKVLQIDGSTGAVNSASTLDNYSAINSMRFVIRTEDYNNNLFLPRRVNDYNVYAEIEYGGKTYEGQWKFSTPNNWETIRYEEKKSDDGRKVYSITEMGTEELVALFNGLKDRSITIKNSDFVYYNNGTGEECRMTTLISRGEKNTFSFLYQGKIFGLELSSDGSYSIKTSWDEQ